MSKSNSYFDWELTFRKDRHTIKVVKMEQDNINSIGIPTSKYKEFVKEWREKNLG
ncbi:MAG: hypothetical protein HWN80_01545 [Candidatus Lokiarchaeota archaeon]|nr:hypothetical protein [Candidatus Lokiarchaeota archaeon]